jgi:hypothetical protein
VGRCNPKKHVRFTDLWEGGHVMTIRAEKWTLAGFGGKIGENVGIGGELAHAHINQKMHQK